MCIDGAWSMSACGTRWLSPCSTQRLAAGSHNTCQDRSTKTKQAHWAKAALNDRVAGMPAQPQPSHATRRSNTMLVWQPSNKSGKHRRCTALQTQQSCVTQVQDPAGSTSPATAAPHRQPRTWRPGDRCGAILRTRFTMERGDTAAPGLPSATCAVHAQPSEAGA